MCHLWQLFVQFLGSELVLQRIKLDKRERSWRISFAISELNAVRLGKEVHLSNRVGEKGLPVNGSSGRTVLAE